MVWAAGLPGSEESSSAHESCCRGIGAKLSWAWGGGKHFHKGLFCSAEVLWRSCRLKQSIRDHSIIITPRESWCRAAHTLQHVHRLLHPSLRLFFFFFVKQLVWCSFPLPQATSIIVFFSFSVFFPALPPLFPGHPLPSDLISRGQCSVVAGCSLCTQTHSEHAYAPTPCWRLVGGVTASVGEKEVCRAQCVDKVMISPSHLPC